MSTFAAINSVRLNTFLCSVKANAFNFTLRKLGYEISSLSLSLLIVCDACDLPPGMRLAKGKRDQPASNNRLQSQIRHLMNTKTVRYLKILRQRIKTIVKLLPGLQTMQF